MTCFSIDRETHGSHHHGTESRNIHKSPVPDDTSTLQEELLLPGTGKGIGGERRRGSA